jgi:hypothetical protein
MNAQKKSLIFLMFLIVPLISSEGQSLSGNYRAAIGVRAGETSGVTFKVRGRNSGSVELLAGLWSDWLNLTALYERNVSAFGVNGMNWYYGGGGHVAFSTGTYYNGGRRYSRGSEYALGVDGVVGLEYKIPPIPFAISLDIKPLVEVYRNGDLFFGLDPGIGVKFAF